MPLVKSDIFPAERPHTMAQPHWWTPQMERKTRGKPPPYTANYPPLKESNVRGISPPFMEWSARGVVPQTERMQRRVNRRMDRAHRRTTTQVDWPVNGATPPAEYKVKVNTTKELPENNVTPPIRRTGGTGNLVTKINHGESGITTLKRPNNEWNARIGLIPSVSPTPRSRRAVTPPARWQRRVRTPPPAPTPPQLPPRRITQPGGDHPVGIPTPAAFWTLRGATPPGDYSTRGHGVLSVGVPTPRPTGGMVEEHEEEELTRHFSMPGYGRRVTAGRRVVIMRGGRVAGTCCQVTSKCEWSHHDAAYGKFPSSSTLVGHNVPLPEIDSAYEKGLGERRGSVPVVSTSPLAEDNMEVPSTPSRLASFFSKKVIKSNLKRTKSVTKLDRKRTINNDIDGYLSNSYPRALINSRMRTSRSHESLLMTHSAMHSIDLSAPDVEIKPLHSSILGQDHCFQVSTTNGSKYYSCRSAHERQKWIQSLRKTVMPNQEQTVRTENSLKLWVLEAKNCPPKKRYFCELSLDKTLYARTSTKQKNDMLFWGEQFDFNNLPPIEVITINLYKEADKKKKKEKNVLVGYVHLNVSDINGRQLTERWYTASSAVVGKAGKEIKGELPLIRIKARYQTVTILPMDLYTPFIDYMQTDFQMLVEVLEPLISVKAKEEIATTMVHTLQRLGNASDFLSDIVMAEVDKIDNENLTFRGNSIATKAMESYMKLVGEKYIQDTLGDFIRTVLDSTEDCEVDPTRVPNNLTLQRHQKNLVMYCEMVWFKIINSYCFFPKELRAVFSMLASRCADRKRPDVSNHLVSACVFLRFLCPAILSPSLFNLTQEYPQERAARNLTLIAKTIQNLANFTKFGSKEEYMTFMNDFVDRELESMKTFTQQISQEPDEKCVSDDFDGYIDLGKQLSILHTVLGESLDKMNEGAEVKLGRLKRILADLTLAKENPQGTLRKLKPAHTNSVHLYDNVSTGSPSHQQGDPNANTNATNQLLTTLMKDYNDADLSRSQDLPVVPNHIVAPVPLPPRPYHTIGSRISSRPPPEPHRSAFDDYVMFSPLDNRAATNHNVAQVRTMPRTERINEQQVNHSWNKMVTAADLVNGQDYIDLISFMDDSHSEGVQNSSAELDNGSQVSIGQLSTVASSGYQSFGYSQSSSPVDSSVQQESSCSSASGQPLSFANPLFQHQNHCHTQTLLPASGSSVNGGPLTDLPRVMSSSSLSSEDGTLSTHSRRSGRKHHTQPSQNGTSPHPHHTASNEAEALRKLSNLSCSSSSCESLGVSGSERRNTSNAMRNGQSPVHQRRTPPYSHLSHSHSLDSRCNVAFDISPVDHGQDNGPMTISELSRSAELPRCPPTASPQQQRMRRTHTADAILSPQPHRGQQQHCAYGRKHSQQNTVRMGVRSVQQRHQAEQDKKADYEAELTLLRQQLAETQAMLQETQRRLNIHDTGTPPDTDEWASQLRLEDARRDKIDKDTQMKGIIKRLLTVEEARRQEQHQLQQLVDEKQGIIDMQERRLVALDMANGRLMSAINQIKEQHRPNGKVTPTQPSQPTVLSLAESGQFRTSSC